MFKEKIMFPAAGALIALYGLTSVLLSSAGCRPKESLALGVNAVCDGNVGIFLDLCTVNR